MDINTATPEALVALGLSEAAACAVVRWRPFSSWDALLQVVEIEAETLAALQAAGGTLLPPPWNSYPKPRPFALSSPAPALALTRPALGAPPTLPAVEDADGPKAP